MAPWSSHSQVASSFPKLNNSSPLRGKEKYQNCTISPGFQGVPRGCPGGRPTGKQMIRAQHARIWIWINVTSHGISEKGMQFKGLRKILHPWILIRKFCPMSKLNLYYLHPRAETMHYERLIFGERRRHPKFRLGQIEISEIYTSTFVE